MKTQRIILPFIYSLVGGLVVYFGVQYFNPQTTQVVTVKEETPSRLAVFSTETGQAADFSFAAEKTVHAVVHVKTVSMVEQEGYSFGNPFFDYFFGPRFHMEPQPVTGMGSGVIISNDGYIITNNHVVDKANEIEVTLNDNRKFKAKIVGTDPSTDLAVIKIDAENLPFIPFGNSEELKIGEWVLAVGNPFNLTSTVTAGIVSAKARNINILADQNPIESFIQTDAAVNPGNSGGALVNLKGELVGINTAIASRTGSFAGYSFAVPTSIAQKVAMDILEFGEVQRAMLGVRISNVNDETMEKYNIKELKGVVIVGVEEEGAAAEAGIKEGDVILEINGIQVNTMNQLQEQISKYRPKDKVEVVINRDGKRKPFQATLRNMRGGFETVNTKSLLEPLGAEFGEVDEKLLGSLGIRGGIQVTKLNDGKLKDGGIKQGFIITRFDKEKVNSIDDLKQILKRVKGAVLVEGVYPNGVVAYYGIGL